MPRGHSGGGKPKKMRPEELNLIQSKSEEQKEGEINWMDKA